MPSDSTTQLQHLINRMRCGDALARADLITRACERLTRLTRKVFQDFRRVHQFEETGDVLQNAVVRLSRRLENLAASDKPESQLPATVREFFSLATVEIRNELLDLTRHYFGPQGQGQHQAKPAPGSGISPVDPADRSNDPAQLQFWTEFHRQVQDLPADEREVFELRWYQGLSAEETANLIGISLATAKRRWLSARILLQPFLEDLLPGAKHV